MNSSGNPDTLMQFKRKETQAHRGEGRPSRRPLRDPQAPLSLHAGPLYPTAARSRIPNVSTTHCVLSVRSSIPNASVLSVRSSRPSIGRYATGVRSCAYKAGGGLAYNSLHPDIVPHLPAVSS
eukprot:3885567-Rhodomonas_salina.2